MTLQQSCVCACMSLYILAVKLYYCKIYFTVKYTVKRVIKIYVSMWYLLLLLVYIVYIVIYCIYCNILYIF